MSSSNTINYASFLGIHSEGAAILFAALYAVCLPYYIFRSWNNRTYVLIFLAIFCLRTSRFSPPSLQLRPDIFVLSIVRVITFAMRAALATISGDNINLLVTELVFYGIGFFGLLLSAFILVNNRLVLLLSPLLPCLITSISSFQLTGVQPSRNLIARISSEQRLFRLILAIAVGLGIAASTMLTPGSSPSSFQRGKELRTASTALFLVLCCALGLHTLFVIRVEHEGSSFIQYRYWLSTDRINLDSRRNFQTRPLRPSLRGRIPPCNHCPLPRQGDLPRSHPFSNQPERNAFLLPGSSTRVYSCTSLCGTWASSRERRG